MKTLYFLGVIAFSFLTIPTLNAQGLMSHNFDDGDMGPFVKCTTQEPNYAKVVNNRLKTYWEETSYNGTRSYKGAEACGDPSTNGVGYLTYKYCWIGFSMYLPTNYIPNNDTEAGLMQIFGFDESLGQSSWTSMLDFNRGDLTWVDRRNYNPKTYATLYENYPKGQWMDIIVHVELSAINRGTVEIFINGDKKYSRYNANVGMGEFNSNDEQDGDSSTEFKIGQYNYDNPNYTPGETRTVYYDNISWYDGSNGYDLVNPAGSTSTSSTLVHITKRNATSFAIDGNRGGDDEQNIYLWEENDANVNQQWIEIDRGSGYYSYQKQNTDYCIDGDNGGANRQNVYLYTCSENNYNQHWQKVNAGGGAYKLIKRNASGYALNGGNRGTNTQTVNLYDSSVTSQNLHWYITPIGTSAKGLDNILATNDVTVFPNPANSTTTISGALDTTMYLYSMDGRLVKSQKISNESETIDLVGLSQGIYYAQIFGSQSIDVIKIVKD